MPTERKDVIMKYVVIIGDGMADYPIESLGGKTPLMVANKPNMDYMAANGKVGLASNVPSDMVPESDTANLAVLGYDPKEFSKGRSPLEAVSMGIEMSPTETAYRVNTVALSEGDVYEELTILDHSADEIPTSESAELIKAVDEALGTDVRKFYPGVSYRHCMIWDNAPEVMDFTRPHDILGNKIAKYLPLGKVGEPYYEIMKKSWEVMKNHPINVKRRERGLLAANSLWIWSPGKKPQLPSFKGKFGLDATVISAVDLIKGIGLCASMKVPDIEGATGNIHTNFEGKAQAAVDALRAGDDLVYVHVEAPDECGHRAELENKIKSIELIDKKIIGFIKSELEKDGEDYRFLILPDHPTPIARRTHTLDPVPYIMFDSTCAVPGNVSVYDETFGGNDPMKVGKYYDKGWNIMQDFVK